MSQISQKNYIPPYRDHRSRNFINFDTEYTIEAFRKLLEHDRHDLCSPIIN